MAVLDKFEVVMRGDFESARCLANRINEFQSRYAFSYAGTSPARGVRSPRCVPLLLLSDNRLLYSATREGLWLSTHDSGPISRYLGVSEGDYLMMGALLALAQWRVLDVNPLIKPEDWLHEPVGTCLYSPCRTVQDYALVMENAHVCSSCREFYWCLGAETELCLIQDLAPRFGRACA